MKNIVKYTIFIGTLFLFIHLTGCKFGPNFEKPEPQVNNTYLFDSIPNDSVVNISWWELFNDPILDSLIKQALDSNQDVLQAAARIEESRAIVGFKKGEALPAFGYGGNASYGNYSGFILPNTNSSAFGGMNLNWEIDFWGKYRRATEAAKADLLASEFNKRSLQISLISEVSSTYFVLLDYQWRKEIAQRTLELREENVKILKQRFEHGLVPEIDVNNSELQYAIALAAIPYYSRLIAYEQTKLSVLLGGNPKILTTGTELENQVIPPSIPAGLPSHLLQRRPDIGFSEAKYHSQLAKIGVAQAQRFPSISLTGLLGAASTNVLSTSPAGLAWNAGASLTGPIFQFGKNKRRVEIEKARTKQTMYEYKKTVITAFKEVEDALISVETYQKELKARELQASSAINARVLSQMRYDKGVTSYLEVITMEGQAFEAELALASVRRMLFLSYIQLYKSLGGGWISEEEKQAATQDNPNQIPEAK